MGERPRSGNRTELLSTSEEGPGDRQRRRSPEAHPRLRWEGTLDPRDLGPLPSLPLPPHPPRAPWVRRRGDLLVTPSPGRESCVGEARVKVPSYTLTTPTCTHFSKSPLVPFPCGVAPPSPSVCPHLRKNTWGERLKLGLSNLQNHSAVAGKVVVVKVHPYPIPSPLR